MKSWRRWGGGGVDEEKIKYEELAKGESQEKEQG